MNTENLRALVAALHDAAVALADAVDELTHATSVPYRCPECGSPEIQSAEWTNPNDANSIVEGDPPLSENVWCETCETHSATFCQSTRKGGPCSMHDHKAGEACHPKKRRT